MVGNGEEVHLQIFLRNRGHRRGHGREWKCVQVEAMFSEDASRPQCKATSGGYPF